MLLKDTVKLVGKGWVQRRKGYRIRFQRRAETGWATEFSPDMKEKSWTSEIATWELARRLAAATKDAGPDNPEGEIVNICVVDDAGEPIPYYATNQSHVLNPRDVEQE